MAANKKILMLLENNCYPQDTRVRREANTLVEAGFQVSIIAPKGPGQSWTEDVDGVYAYRFPAPMEADGFLGYIIEFGYSLIAMFFVSLIVAFRRGFRVIHAHNPPEVLVLIAMFYKLFGKKFVFDHHDLSPELYNAKADGQGNNTVIKALHFFEKLTFRFANRVISTNESYKKIAMTRGNVPEEHITIVRNGPMLDKIKEVQPDPELAGKAACLIGYLGEMGFQDGLDYLIRAVHHLVTEFKREDVYAVLIGRGSAVESLKQQVADLKLEKYVHFAGYQPDHVWRPMLAAMHMGAVPDPMNPFNNQSTMIKITDYMSLRKPVVAFDLVEHRYTAGEAALYAKSNDVEDFAKQIMTLMDSPAMREKMGEVGYERIINELAWKYQAERLVQMYQGLLG